MFRKLVSNLSYSPALVGRLGFYARRLKREETTRRIGLVFTALALTVQSLAVISPPEAANAASSADFVRGGVSSPADFLNYYDRNSNNIKDIYKSLGITRAEIADTKLTVIGEASRYNWSMTSLYSYAQGQRSYSYDKANGTEGTVFYRPMRLTQEGGDRHEVFAGHSKELGWFAIKKDCGNLITAHPPVVKNPEAVCQRLTVERIAPDRFRMNSFANTKDGAKIRKYEYVVKDSSKKVIFTQSFPSTAEKHSFVYKQATPGAYHAKVTVHTSEGEKSGKDCQDSFVVAKEPAAYCTQASAVIADRTIVTLSGSARAVNKATISKYVFVVKNSDGKQVKRVVVTSHKEDVTADSFTVTKAGTYSVILTVHTSEGKKTSSDCQTQFTIVKPEVCAYNPQLPVDDPRCQPCPDNPELWIDDEQCEADVVSTKSAINMTQGNVSASSVVARASDKISYTISVENNGGTSAPITLKESLEDVLEYATLIDMGGGSFDQSTKMLSWAPFNLKPGEKQSRTLAIQLLSAIPATNTGTSNEASFDCVMTNTFGNSIDVRVTCPSEKVVVEQVVSELPQTGPRENMMFAAVLFAVVVYFYARSRQMGKEIRLIRHDLNTGAI
ncbi:TPA: hypothetical protein DIV49_02635 [Candidatus Saccharibacteria bacterium]|nr:hypothetical protein [Candidatus Saccharibacteria bacterium]